jgi:DNA-binding NtrC family response regulator
MPEKVLFVDDDQNILASHQRMFRKQFALHTAMGGEEGLGSIAAHGPFAVIVSDMQMPIMNGVKFLTKARKLAPDSVRMILTGYADMQTAIEAVNEGHIFRFLTKPCHPEALAKALTAGIAQYRLLTAEKELTEKGILGITGQTTILDASPVLQQSIRLRNPYIDPMSCIQVELLRRMRELPESDPGREKILLMVLHCINGIAAGLQTTG